MTGNLHKVPRSVESFNSYYSRHLDSDSYSKPDKCEFSEFLQRFKPEELEINCGNVHQIKIGKLLGKAALCKACEGKWQGQNIGVKMVKYSVESYIMKIA